MTVGIGTSRCEVASLTSGRRLAAKLVVDPHPKLTFDEGVRRGTSDAKLAVKTKELVDAVCRKGGGGLEDDSIPFWDESNKN